MIYVAGQRSDGCGPPACARAVARSTDRRRARALRSAAISSSGNARAQLARLEQEARAPRLAEALLAGAERLVDEMPAGRERPRDRREQRAVEEAEAHDQIATRSRAAAASVRSRSHARPSRSRRLRAPRARSRARAPRRRRPTPRPRSHAARGTPRRGPSPAARSTARPRGRSGSTSSRKGAGRHSRAAGPCARPEPGLRERGERSRRASCTSREPDARELAPPPPPPPPGRRPRRAPARRAAAARRAVPRARPRRCCRCRGRCPRANAAGSRTSSHDEPDRTPLAGAATVVERESRTRARAPSLTR